MIILGEPADYDDKDLIIIDRIMSEVITKNYQFSLCIESYDMIEYLSKYKVLIDKVWFRNGNVVNNRLEVVNDEIVYKENNIEHLRRLYKYMNNYVLIPIVTVGEMLNNLDE